MQNTTQTQRVFLLIEKLGMSVRAFEIAIGVSNGTMYHKKDKGTISMNLANKIIKTFPQVSFNWLINGEGAMYMNDENSSEEEYSEKLNTNITENSTELFELYRQLLQQKDETIELLRERVRTLENQQKKH